MLFVYFFIFAWLICGGIMIKLYNFRNTFRFKAVNPFPFIIILGFAIRVFLTFMYHGHKTDMNCFKAWSDMLFEDGFKAFYPSDSFTDYPPGYMYILYFVGALRQLVTAGIFQSLIVKLPAIIFDCITGYIIYSFSKEKLTSCFSSVIAAFYILNPAVILNSSLWGQVDSVHTLFNLLFVILLHKKQIVKATFVFWLCVFIKPQSLMLTPLLIFAVFENSVYPEFNIKKLIHYAVSFIGGIAIFIILSIPFGVIEVLKQYTDTVSSYPYATINAFNIWGMLGKNWDKLSFITSFSGYLGIFAVCIASTYFFLIRKSENRYFTTGALLIFGTFMVSTHMHERYAFTAMALLVTGFAVSLSEKNFMSYILISASQFFNYGWVLLVYETNPGEYFKSPVIVIASIVNIIIMGYFIYTLINPACKTKTIISTQISKTLKKPTLTRFDKKAVTIITLIYSIIAFSNLGGLKNPQTEYSLTEASVIDMGSDINISDIFIYLSANHVDEERTIDITVTDSYDNLVFTNTLEDDTYVFDWTPIEINERGRYITLTSNNLPVTFMEIAVRDNQKILVPANASDFPGLFDEPELVPDETSFMNSMYFDEIYHARSAYEYIEGVPIYEWTHPPLGKLLISVGILIFGMNPFGWRFMGTLFGIIMIPVMYIFIKRVFKKSGICVTGCLIFTFDFMHFVQTRISTVDVFTVTFVMLMYYFMYDYCSMSFYDTKLKKMLKPLMLSGLFMGLAISCKWNSVYAAVGLALIFFYSLYTRFCEYKYACTEPENEINQKIIKSFIPNTYKTILWCLLFFVAIPLVIYVLSYIPFMRCSGEYSLRVLLENQKDMYIYHSKTVVGTPHSFSSKWYEWIVMKRPVWFYSADYSNGLKGGISTFGNPIVWWGGILAVFANIFIAIRYRDKKAIFLITAYFSQLVFWMPIARTTYIYHYFPMVPFLCLMICNCMQYSYLYFGKKSKYFWKKCG